jgi:hypothetical protein
MKIMQVVDVAIRLSFCDGFAADYVAAAVVTGGVSVVL